MALAIRSASSRVCGASARRGVRTVRPNSRATTVSVKAWKVTLVMPDNQRKTIEVSGDEQILGAAEAAGLELPYSCRAGVCATCAGKVISEGDGPFNSPGGIAGSEPSTMAAARQGGVDQTYAAYLTVDQRAEGYVLTCVGVPVSDVTILTHQAEKVQTEDKNQVLVSKSADVTA